MASLELTYDELNELLYSLGDTFRNLDSSLGLEIAKAARNFMLIYENCPLEIQEHNERTRNQILEYWIVELEKAKEKGLLK